MDSVKAAKSLKGADHQPEVFAMRKLPIVFAAALAVVVVVKNVPVRGHASGVRAPQAAAQSPAIEPPPSDLRPLLAPAQSEMRLVQAWYVQDRATLAGNYVGSMRSSPVAAVELSPGRLARLKRFDLDWQAALARLDTPRLSEKGRSDLRLLTDNVAANLKALDKDAAALAQVLPLVPFAPPLVALVEARIRLEDIDAEKAAGVLADGARQITEMTRRIDGVAPLPGESAAPADLRHAHRAANAADLLRSSLKEWFTFYNGYDPLFTWWMGAPYKRVDAALEAYGNLLRQKAEAADPEVPGTSGPAPSEVTPASPPKYPSVPELATLIGLAQDEMTPIVQRFRAAIGRSGGRGGAPPAARPAEPPPKPGAAFFEAWLSALKTLDFDRLTRNAQVDYLFIRRTCEQQLARSAVALPASPPRKTDASGIPGPARGRQGLVFDLQDEFIPYMPEELIAIGEGEFAWCEREMKKASVEMGLGEDWKRAIEKVKEVHPPPGGQAAVVRNLMFEAVDYLRAHDLLTVPAVAAESLHMIMMTPERQLVNPFFTGGSLISVSYPHDTMEYEARIQSMRGNNTPFSHATAFHEMIPGHNLVFYTGSRFAGYRPSLAGGSPFYGEGWPLYWEMLLYDLGFHATPEQRVGALFWRMHRCARIVFSLKFHMGAWSPQECIDYLVDRVGFERDNATAEVRRSFQGGYGPLYQAAYLLGGLQLRALRRELVEGGKLTARRFHDEVLRQGSMPIALLRLAIGDQKLTREMPLEWRFAEGAR